MKKELEIPTVALFCKNCFNTRRDGSAYCGNCTEERFPIYWDITKNFPMLSKVRKQFDIKLPDLENIVFTYGDTVYSYAPLSYGLVAHEITHVLQQTKMGAEKWWKQYLKDPKFRMEQELEAYRRQYKVYCKRNARVGADMLIEMAEDLSGKIYGNIMSFDEAKQLISQ